MKESSIAENDVAPVWPTMNFMSKKVLNLALESRQSLADLGPKEAAVWQHVLAMYPLLGRAPKRQKIADALERESLRDLQAVLERLHALDLLGMTSQSLDIQYAYPFSSVPTNHVVTFLNWPTAKPVYAMCAVDALGIPFMFKKDAAIRSSCPHCDHPIVIEVRSGRIVSRDQANTVVWVGDDRTECAAASVCPTLNFFCSSAHVEAWRNGNLKKHGLILSLGEALFVGRGLFEDLLSPGKGQMRPPESATEAFSESTTTTVTTTGGLLVAFLASLCCLGPLVLAALGVGVGATGFLASTAGALKALLPYRPYFIGLTAVFFGVAFYFSYRRPTAACAPGSSCASSTGTRLNRTILWVVAAVALGFILAPYWLGL